MEAALPAVALAYCVLFQAAAAGTYRAAAICVQFAAPSVQFIGDIAALSIAVSLNDILTAIHRLLLYFCTL